MMNKLTWSDHLKIDDQLILMTVLLVVDAIGQEYLFCCSKRLTVVPMGVLRLIKMDTVDTIDVVMMSLN